MYECIHCSVYGTASTTVHVAFAWRSLCLVISDFPDTLWMTVILCVLLNTVLGVYMPLLSPAAELGVES